MKIIIVNLICAMFLTTHVLAQTTVKAKVLDAYTKKPLVGANIIIDDKKAITDNSGMFSYQCTAKENIKISYVGYESKIENNKNCNTDFVIYLTPTVLTLYEVEVSNSTNSNKTLLYQPAAITNLNQTEIKRATGLFFDDAIQTNVPGVQMARRSVGGGQQFNIRGYGNGVRGKNGASSNFDGQGSKVYLNGIPVTDAEGITTMDDIDFGSIAAAEIVKGPAGSLYGLAIAGAINLKTIQPEKGKTSIGQEYITANPSSNKLYVSHGTKVNILDKKTGDSIGVIENTTGVHGIAFINKLGKGYTSNGKLNSVTVFDLATQKVINQIPTGENPDAIFYEPFSKTIITCNGRSKNLTVIDPITEKVIATIEVGGKPETAVSNEVGMVYVNVEDKNEIVAIDITKHQVMAHWPINAEEPTGLAIDSKTKRLFAGANEKLVIVNAKDGNIVSTLPIGAGCDGVAYDNGTKNIYTSNGSGTMTVIHALNADTYKIIGNLVTKKGARTIGIDESTHTLYLPTANFEPQEANDKSRPKMIPGTFQILVIK